MRRILYIVTALLVAELAYVAGARVFLASGTFAALLNPPDGSTHISVADPWSYVPGRVQGRELTVAGRHAHLSWALRIERATVSIDLLALLHREIVLTRGDGDEATLTFATGGQPEVAEESPSESGTEWGVRLEAIDIRHLRSITVDDVRIDGDAEVTGGLVVTKAGELALPPTAVRLDKATVNLLGKTIGTVETATATATFAATSMDGDVGATLLKRLDAETEIDGAVTDNRWLNYFLAETQWLSVSGSGGTVKATIAVKDGAFVPGSELEVVSERIGARALSQDVHGRGRATWRAVAGEKPRAEFRVVFGEYDVRRVGDPSPAIVGHELRLELQTSDLGLVQPFKTWTGDVTMPEARLQSFTYLNAFLPKSLGLVLRGGTGAVSTKLHVASASPAACRGDLRLTAQKVDVRYERVVAQGDVHAELALHKCDLRTGRFDLGGSRIALTNVATDVEGDKNAERSTGWWGNLTIQTGKVRVLDPVELDGTVHVEGRDIVPLVEVYAATAGMPAWLRRMLRLERVDVTAELHATERDLKVPRFSGSVSDIAFRGWFEGMRAARKGRVLVNYKALSLGLGLAGDKTEWKLLGAKAWYERAH